MFQVGIGGRAMLRTVSATSTVVLLSLGAAKADISADLKFCAGLKSSPERLACYDAAARIERHADQKVVAHTSFALPVPAANAMAYLPPTEPQSRFDGAYVGVTAGYDIPTASPSTIAESYYTTPSVPDGSISGAKLGLVAGYNATSGPLLLGFEARATYNFNESSGSETSRYYPSVSSYPIRTPPFITQQAQCQECNFDNWPTTASPYQVSSSVEVTSRASRPWQVDFAPRFGFVVQDWLFFAKAGVGVEVAHRSAIIDNTASVTCTDPIVERRRPSADVLQIAVVGCAATTNGTKTVSVANSIVPTAIVGFGVERNFGDYFARAEAEVTAHLVSGNTYYTPAVNFTAGYRF